MVVIQDDKIILDNKFALMCQVKLSLDNSLDHYCALQWNVS